MAESQLGTKPPIYGFCSLALLCATVGRIVYAVTDTTSYQTHVVVGTAPSFSPSNCKRDWPTTRSVQREDLGFSTYVISGRSGRSLGISHPTTRRVAQMRSEA